MLLSKRILGILIIILLLVLAVRTDCFWGRIFVKGTNPKVLNVEPGDLLYRANSLLLASGQLYSYSGMPGHVSVVLTESTFLSDDPLMGGCQVAEARIYDHTEAKIKKSTAITFAHENFGIRRKDRRFILHSHLTEEEIACLLNFVNSNMDKPFRLLAGKDDTVAFNCSSFARQAILNASGKDVDGNRGAIVFPNDILSSPLFDAPGDRVRF